MQTDDDCSACAANNVFDIFSGMPINSKINRIIRISPELDGLEMLYGNDNTSRIYSLKIVCWALFENGEVTGMVPWLNGIIPCFILDDPLNGHWEGYRDPGTDDIFFNPPQHKLLELKAASEYFGQDEKSSEVVIQEIPDCIGTHAVLANKHHKSFMLSEVNSWRLTGDGIIHGMLTDQRLMHSTPVLPGDDCLYSAQKHPHFRYFFQHRIANKLKERDPEALAAISLLMSGN